jgi:hypothetical protein
MVYSIVAESQDLKAPRDSQFSPSTLMLLPGHVDIKLVSIVVASVEG